MNDYSGRTLGKYQLIERLGRGGMADVYKAYQPGLDRFVAVKTMHGHLAEEAEFIERFKREAQSVAALRHAHIIQVIDFDIQDGAYYMVMEYIKSDTLKAYIQRKGIVPADEALRLTIQLASALDYAHENGMIHRDIKPANIMFQDNGFKNVVLTDFGIARILDASNLTMSGMTVGTPAYMSPEAGRGAKVDERADIYSLGIVLYEMLSGHVPYDADTPFAVIMKHINDPLPPLNQFNVDLPDSVEKLLLKALAKDPDDRFQTAAEFETALRKALENLAHEQATAVKAASPASLENTLVDSSGTVRAPDAQPTLAQAKSPSRLPIFAVVGVIIVAIIVVALLARPGQPEVAALPTEIAAETPSASGAESSSALTGTAEATAEVTAENTWAEIDALVLAAQAAESEENFAAAADAYSQLIELNDENEEYYVGRGWANYNQQNWELAQADFEKATDIDPNNADAYIGLGNTLSDTDDHEGAIRAFSRAAALEPRNPEPTRGLGWAYREVNDYERSIEAFSSAIEKTTDREALIDLYDGRGDSYMDLSNSDDAIKDYDAAIELDPENPVLIASRGWAYYVGGQYESAIENFTQAIDLKTEDVRVYLQRAMAYRALAQPEPAIADLNLAIETDPNFLDAFIQRAELHYDLSDYQNALTDISRAIELNPGNATLYGQRGWVYLSLEETDRAITSFTRAVELAPDDISVYIERASAYRTVGQPEKALVDYEKALEIDPTDSYIFERRGWTYLELDEPRDAREDFTSAIELNAEEATFFFGRGRAAARLGDTEDAIEDFTQSIALSPNYADVFFERGLAYAQLENYVPAISDLQDALALDSYRPDILADLGFIYDDADRPEEALATFQKYVEMMGDSADPEVVERIEELEEDIDS